MNKIPLSMLSMAFLKSINAVNVSLLCSFRVSIIEASDEI